LWLTVSVRKYDKLSSSVQAELQASAEEAGTDVATFIDKV